MKISPQVLRRFYPTLPVSTREVRLMFDDLGLEVKREEEAGFTLELLANRGDHRCYLGVAREVAGRLGGAVRVPASSPLVSPEELAAQTRISVEVSVLTSACLAYAAVPMQIRTLHASLAPEAQAVLAAAGLRSVDPVVDATNIANLELGQPTHAFDAAKVIGGITVRLSHPGEMALPLFQEKPIELPEGTLVIADAVKILAIAGVIGCEESKVTAATTDVILESACFDPVMVHKASRKLGIQTDASARFERGSDPGMVEVGAGRVLWLLEEAGVARRTGPATVMWGWDDAPRIVKLDIRRLGNWYGRPFTLTEVQDRLGSLGFGVVGEAPVLEVSVPTWRSWDIKNPEDLYEEVGRAIGYNSLPSFLPPVGLGGVLNAAEVQRQRLEAVLLGNGFYEVLTDGFYGRSGRDSLGISEGHPLWNHVEMLNSLDKGFSLLKNNGLVQALEGLVENQNMNLEQVRVFEVTRCFHPDSQAANGFVRERPVLWLAVMGPERDVDWAHRPAGADVHFLKGLVEEFAAELGIHLSLSSQHASPLADCFHPHRQAGIFQRDRQVGVLGEVHPRLVKTVGLRRHRPLYLELDLLSLQEEAELPVLLPPARPYSVRSLAFTVAHGVESASILSSLRRHGPASLERLKVVDRFEHKQEAGKPYPEVGLRHPEGPAVTLTIELAYRNDDATLTVELLNSTTLKLIEAVLAEGNGRVELRQ